jgi:hypothetical protein
VERGDRGVADRDDKRRTWPATFVVFDVLTAHALDRPAWPMETLAQN